MKYISTGGDQSPVSFREATLNGLAPDKGLYVPVEIPRLNNDFIQSLRGSGTYEIAEHVLSAFVSNDINSADLSRIITDVFDFEIPLVHVENDIQSLELFHGPTLSFKDVGARFLARCIACFKEKTKQLTILVATSGDTGSAVASGFWKMHGIRVVVLFPEGGVSKFQESQMTTLGKNITVLEVKGVFDDCQRLVKTAFADEDLNEKVHLTSANSINIARWIAQSVYYFLAYKQSEPDTALTISVPTGNLGNLTAGLLAKKMGLPVRKFVAATNRNRVITDYIQTGIYETKLSVTTVSNAMDVGDPSNYERLMYLYDGSLEQIREDVESFSFSDEETIQTIRDVYRQTNYLLDPHGAVSYLALRTYFHNHKTDAGSRSGIFLETAHPKKFAGPVKEAVPAITFDGQEPESKPEKISIANDFNALKNIILNLSS